MEEQVPVYVPAVLYDTLYYPDGRVIHLPPVKNVIQVSFGLLLAALTSGKNATAITYMEVGSGNPSWDASPPPPAASTGETGLIAGINRQAPTLWDWLNQDNTVAGGATARVGAHLTFGIGIANGTLRELAMYGGAAATATLGTGTLVNVLRHVAISKAAGAADFSLARLLVLQF